MNNDVAIIEEIYDKVLPEVPSSLHRWGRIVWVQDIEVGAKGKFLYYEKGVSKVTNLSIITKVIRTSNSLEIHTKCSIYKLKILPSETMQQ